jgi:hypothetical protein
MATQNPYSDSLLMDALRGSLSNAESLGRGFAVAPVGLLGDINSLARQYVTPRLPQSVQGLLQSAPAAPTTEQILSNIPRVSNPRMETVGMEQLGAAMNPRGPVDLARGAGRLAGSAVNEAMVYGRGPLASITPQPMRAVELGSEFLGKNPPKIENLARTSDKFLFHSSTADKAKDLKYGVEPQAGGNWVREIAAGATDQNLDDFFENVTPLAWFSDKPEWIKAMVGRKLNKPFDKVTAKDIEEHGHLAFINKKSPEAENITYIPEQGLMEGSQSVVYDINKANPRKAWETGLYQEGRYGSQMEPFGVEKNEYVSPESVEPLIQLTGPELVQFMKIKGLLD